MKRFGLNKNIYLNFQRDKGFDATNNTYLYHEENNGIFIVSIDKLELKSNTQTNYNQDYINELAESFKKSNHMIQPIVVTPNEHGKYTIIAGVRRFLAAKIASFSDVPIMICAESDSK